MLSRTAKMVESAKLLMSAKASSSTSIEIVAEKPPLETEKVLTLCSTSTTCRGDNIFELEVTQEEPSQILLPDILDLENATYIYDPFEIPNCSPDASVLASLAVMSNKSTESSVPQNIWEEPSIETLQEEVICQGYEYTSNTETSFQQEVHQLEKYCDRHNKGKEFKWSTNRNRT